MAVANVAKRESSGRKKSERRKKKRGIQKQNRKQKTRQPWRIQRSKTQPTSILDHQILSACPKEKKNATTAASKPKEVVPVLDDDDGNISGDAGTDQDDVDENLGNNGIGRRERARLKEIERLKRKKIQEILDSQNAAIDPDMNKKGKGRLRYLLEQTEIFAHFAKGSSSSSQKKPRGRGRHASKLTEEEEDEECLKEEDDDY